MGTHTNIYRGCINEGYKRSKFKRKLGKKSGWRGKKLPPKHYLTSTANQISNGQWEALMGRGCYQSHTFSKTLGESGKSIGNTGVSKGTPATLKTNNWKRQFVLPEHIKITLKKHWLCFLTKRGQFSLRNHVLYSQGKTCLCICLCSVIIHIYV